MAAFPEARLQCPPSKIHSGRMNRVSCKTKDSQYHHFIPRFILRNFASSSQPPSGPSQSSKRRQKKRRNAFINSIDLESGNIGPSWISEEFGIRDMYREGNKDDAFELEKRLSELERQAAEIIQRAIDTFATPGNVLRLHRGDRDCLRKFFFLMKYRNRNLHQRHGHDSLDTYEGEDKEVLADYMKRKGFKSPRDVWLANIHAFISLEMDPDLKWIPRIQSTAYQLDAITFILHAQGSFTAFCTPASPSQEFVLTENSYGVFEGPTSPLIDPESGAILGCLDLEYHTFAPISPRLIIVFRSFLLGDVADDGSRQMRALLFDLLRQLRTKPDQARSLLHDLPVVKCHNSYSTIKDGKAVPVHGYKGPRSSDVFFFKCFPLAAGHVDLINEIFLSRPGQRSTSPSAPELRSSIPSAPICETGGRASKSSLTPRMTRARSTSESLRRCSRSSVALRSEV